MTQIKAEESLIDTFTDHVSKETTKRLLLNSKNISVLMLEKDLNKTNKALDRAQDTGFLLKKHSIV